MHFGYAEGAAADDRPRQLGHPVAVYVLGGQQNGLTVDFGVCDKCELAAVAVKDEHCTLCPLWPKADVAHDDGEREHILPGIAVEVAEDDRAPLCGERLAAGKPLLNGALVAPCCREDGGQPRGITRERLGAGCWVLVVGSGRVALCNRAVAHGDRTGIAECGRRACQSGAGGGQQRCWFGPRVHIEHGADIVGAKAWVGVTVVGKELVGCRVGRGKVVDRLARLGDAGALRIGIEPNLPGLAENRGRVDCADAADQVACDFGNALVGGHKRKPEERETAQFGFLVGARPAGFECRIGGCFRIELLKRREIGSGQVEEGGVGINHGKVNAVTLGKGAVEECVGGACHAAPGFGAGALRPGAGAAVDAALEDNLLTLARLAHIVEAVVRIGHGNDFFGPVHPFGAIPTAHMDCVETGAGAAGRVGVDDVGQAVGVDVAAVNQRDLAVGAGAQ